MISAKQIELTTKLENRQRARGIALAIGFRLHDRNADRIAADKMRLAALLLNVEKSKD